MRLTYTTLLGSAAIAACLGLVAAVQAQDAIHQAMAKMSTADGKSAGAVTFNEPIKGQGVVIDAILTNLPQGAHAIHIHEAGKCEPPEFKSAGGHYNPTNKKHGIKSDGGMHAGDLPNFHVLQNGQVHVEMFAINLSLDTQLLDEDGAAVVIHSGADDYETQPSGKSGTPLACGVITTQQQRQ